MKNMACGSQAVGNVSVEQTTSGANSGPQVQTRAKPFGVGGEKQLQAGIGRGLDRHHAFRFSPPRVGIDVHFRHIHAKHDDKRG